MKPEIVKLRADVREAQSNCDRAKSKLMEVVRNCKHKWSAPEADHIYEKGYRVEGDPPGVGGVDRQLPFYVEPKTTKRWKRVCDVCGEVEHTSKVTRIETELPQFGLSPYE